MTISDGKRTFHEDLLVPLCWHVLVWRLG